MKHMLCLCLIVVIWVFHPVPVHAQNAEHIQTLEIVAGIRTDGTVHMSERIEYVFQEPRHGIMRNIPSIKKNADGKKYRLTIDNIYVQNDNGAKYPFSTSWNSESLTLKIGDPDMTITGTQRYMISYDVSGAITYFSDHDELYWNMVGNEWNVPVALARAVVTIPENVQSGRMTGVCYTGKSGSSISDCSMTASDSAVVIQTTEPLEAYEGLTTAVSFPKGIVAQLEPKEVIPFFTTLLGRIVLICIVLAAIVWYIVIPVVVVRKWWIGGRDPKPAMGEVAAWFEPPKTKSKRILTPAETGSLIDERADVRDMYASIIDLARRGYLVITEVKKGEFDLAKKKDWQNDHLVLAFERVLLDGMLKTKETVHLKDLNLVVPMKKATDMVYELVVKEGIFSKNPNTIRMLYSIFAVFAAITCNPLLLLVSLTFGLHMPKKTMFGAQQAAVARSLKNFLASQKKQLAFQVRNQMMFEKLLPYAIAFGVEKIWAERFRSVALKNPDWYISSEGNRFNSVVFASSISRGMTQSFSAATVSRSSSGFSSGSSGGFSGGGGGGGGSW